MGLLGGGAKRAANQEKGVTDQGSWVRKGLGERAFRPPQQPCLPEPLASRLADRVPASWGVAWELFT